VAEAAIVPAINTGVQAREWLAITSHWHSNGFGPVLGYYDSPLILNIYGVTSKPYLAGIAVVRGAVVFSRLA